MTKRRPPGASNGGQFTRDSIEESGVDIAERARLVENPMLDDNAFVPVVGTSEFRPREDDQVVIPDINPVESSATNGRMLRDALAQRYHASDRAQQKHVKNTARGLKMAPFRFVASFAVAPVLAPFGVGPDWKSLWTGLRLRKVITNDEVARCGAILMVTEARGLTKGVGRDQIECIRASIQQDRADAKATKWASRAAEAARTSRLPLPKAQGLPTAPPKDAP